MTISSVVLPVRRPLATRLHTACSFREKYPTGRTMSTIFSRVTRCTGVYRAWINGVHHSPRHQFIYTSADANRLCRNDRSPAIL